MGLFSSLLGVLSTVPGIQRAQKVTVKRKCSFTHSECVISGI